MSFLFFGKGKEKKNAVITQTAMDKILAAQVEGANLDNETIQFMLAESDGKISTAEKKLLKKNMKQSNRTTRSDFRNQSRKVAYEHGIDPNAGLAKAIGDGLGNVGKSSSPFGKMQGAGGSPESTLDNVFGKIKDTIGVGTPSYTGEDVESSSVSSSSNSSMLLLAGVGIFLLVMMKKR